MKIGSVELLNIDCMEYMKTVQDKHFDLAIVDPPYGIGANKMTLGNGKKKVFRGSNDWDAEIPKPEYFTELKRVSNNQVIWGGNYMTEFLTPTSAWLFWDKGTGDNDFADGELAWTSFEGALRKINKTWVGANAKDEATRFHPTQKPIYLYKWILKKYAIEGFKILDTHGGSASLGVACIDYKFEAVICEIDKDYYEAAVKRLKNHVAQTVIF